MLIASSRDHPRSRGVYTWWQCPTGSRRGSSPLARGLRRPERSGNLGRRIIPARAGFTSQAPRSPSPGPDHPRSRGVYFESLQDSISTSGSSPLARGLPGPRPALRDDLGIIPARAGFTAAWHAPWPRRSDHPRSRGVYPWAAFLARLTTGSSPLARGLPGRGAGRPGRQGIIPARAGFTRPGACDACCEPDHPRSRGVYVTGAELPENMTGSSPLARGLPPSASPSP